MAPRIPLAWCRLIVRSWPRGRWQRMKEILQAMKATNALFTEEVIA
jgi:hypothetical protein